jgi:hypothetical protein
MRPLNLRRFFEHMREMDAERMRVQGEQIENIQLECRRHELNARSREAERARRGAT